MFSSKEYLAKKTGPHGVGRLSFLQELVDEFQTTDSEDSKLQVLANLANFAYDPINYEYLRQLNAIDLFLDCLTENNETMIQFAIGGLCNLVLDKANKDYILKNDGIKLVSQCLSSADEETVLSAITTMMFMMTPTSRNELTSVIIVDAMLRFSMSSNPRLSNLAQIFLKDYCPVSQVRKAEAAQQQWTNQVHMQSTSVIASSDTS
jgi:hypothetical protein